MTGHLVVCCYCHKAYDLWDVAVTHRYADCSMWNAPCCGRQVDDRPWVRHYTELTSHDFITDDSEVRRFRADGSYVRIGRVS